MELRRCSWCESTELMAKYHDQEWGVPLHDDKKIFEFIVLESAQAGLSWATVLKKRENYRRAFSNFAPEKISEYGSKDISRLLKDTGIIRNRQKIEAAINNAARFLEIKREFGSFSRYMWNFVGGRPVINKWKDMKQLPAKTELSDSISADLKKRGFRFFGSTICYAHMQATGIVNDHVTNCFRYREIAGPYLL